MDYRKRNRDNTAAVFLNGKKGQVTNDTQEIANARGRFLSKLGEDAPDPHFNDQYYKDVLQELEVLRQKDKIVNSIKTKTSNDAAGLLKQVGIKALEDPEGSDNQDLPEDPFNSDITTLEMESARKRLKNRKSPGLDGVTSAELKYGKEETDHRLKRIYNFCWNKDVLPNVWKTAKVVSLFKKGDKRDLGNYRGISLHSYARKVFTTIINARLTRYLEENNLLCTAQNGFRNVGKRNCPDQW